MNCSPRVFQKSFDDFMWKKVTGCLTDVKIHWDGSASRSTESAMKKYVNFLILEKHGVKYPDWKTAKEVLRKYGN